MHKAFCQKDCWNVSKDLPQIHQCVVCVLFAYWPGTIEKWLLSWGERTLAKQNKKRIWSEIYFTFLGHTTLHKLQTILGKLYFFSKIPYNICWSRHFIYCTVLKHIASTLPWPTDKDNLFSMQDEREGLYILAYKSLQMFIAFVRENDIWFDIQCSSNKVNNKSTLYVQPNCFAMVLVWII